MKRLLIFVVSASCALLTHADIREGLSGRIGYVALDLSDYSFAHDTHPDDSFLPGSGIPGSAGTTTLDDHLHFAELGGRFTKALSERLALNLDLSFLLGNNKDRRQNSNDARPAGNAAFIQSRARFGMIGGIGSTYHFDNGIYLGGNAYMTGLLIESGWDRFDSFDRVEQEIDYSFSAGPRLGYYMGDSMSIEAFASFGNSNLYGISFSFGH